LGTEADENGISGRAAADDLLNANAAPEHFFILQTN
jgi:hypothetical protein